MESYILIRFSANLAEFSPLHPFGQTHEKPDVVVEVLHGDLEFFRRRLGHQVPDESLEFLVPLHAAMMTFRVARHERREVATRATNRLSFKQCAAGTILLYMDQAPNKPRHTPVASRILEDGTLVELIYDRSQKRTAFAVYRDGQVSIEDTINLSDEVLHPYSPDNNLIVHGAVLLPSGIEPYGDINDLRRDIQAFIHRYVDLSDTFELIATHYVMLSWVHDAFNELPYLRLQGDYGTGKTRTLLALGSLAYRAFFASGASTVSPIFHTLNAFGGTLIFDEADFRMSDEKAELVKILNNGTVKGIPVLRTLQNQKREFNPAAFQVFGPKIVATRGTFDDRALESRFLTELMSGRRLRDDIPINLPPAFSGEALHLRNQLLSYRLTERHNVRLDPSLIDPTLEPRHNQILIPLLSITDDERLRDDMRDSLRISGHSLLAERSASIEGELLGVILRLFETNPTGSLPLKTVHNIFVDKYGDGYERPVTARYLSSILRRKLSIRVMKSMGVMAIPRSEEPRVQEIGKRYGLGGPTFLSRDVGMKGESEEGSLPVELKG